MIELITVTNHLDESLIIELRSPNISGLAVSFIEGLGPPKANISLSERAGIDGAAFNSSRAEYRNLLIGFKYMPTPDVETNRLKTYKYFPLQREIRISAISENREVYVYGRVESNEPDIFSKDSGCTISILCPQSYLYDVDEAVTIFSSITGGFTFPFANNSLVDPLLTFGDIDLETEKNIIYNGDAPIGMLLHIHATGSASGFTLTNFLTLETLAIDSDKLVDTVGADITIGDDFYISTVSGNKYAILIRGGQEYNILDCLGDNPTWFELERGDNLFAYTAISGLSNLEFVVTNDVAYEGI